MLQTLMSRFITLAANVLITLPEQGAMISNFFPSEIIGFSMFSIWSTLLISASDTKMCVSSKTHSSFLWSLIKRLDV